MSARSERAGGEGSAGSGLSVKTAATYPTELV